MDILIIGGGPAGLGAALAIGRMGLTALVCDDGQPRNASAAHMNNFPSRDGMPPGAWRAQVRSELEKYPTISFTDASIRSVKSRGEGFVATSADGADTFFRKVILAHGVRDRLPSLPGLAELWGKSIYHCPYCHGFEVRGRRLGLVANGHVALHLTPMVFALSEELILFTNGPADLPDDFRANLQARSVRLVEHEINGFRREGDRLLEVLLKDGEAIPREGLFWAPALPFDLKSSIGVEMGCARTEMGFYRIDAFGKTTVQGVFAAGDAVSGMHSVLNAAASGQIAGAAAVAELLNEDFAR